MSKFQYRIQDGQGKLMEGVLEAPSETHAQKFLAKHEYQILSLKKKAQEFSLQSVTAPFETVRPTDFNFFVRQMATLLKAGIPILSCLSALQEEMRDKILKEAVQDIYQSVEQGNSFSESIARHPKIFNALFISTVRAGEAIGELDTVLGRLADVLERDYQVRSKIQAAVRYPQLVGIAMFAAFLIATIFIIPRFKDLFALFGSRLPLPSRVLLLLSDGMVQYWYVVLFLAVMIGGALYYHYQTFKGRRFWDGLSLKTWILGDFLRYAIFSRFSRMLGIMLKSGVNILNSLDLVAQIVGNSIVSDAILRMKDKVAEGEAMSVQMKREHLFPNLVIQMVYAGEASGKVDELLTQIAEHYDAELELMIKNMETLIEPLFIILLGSFVMLMALAIFLPMWDLYGLIATKSG